VCSCGLRVAQKFADDWKAKRRAGADAREGMPQIVKPHAVEPSGLADGGPGLFKVRAPSLAPATMKGLPSMRGKPARSASGAAERYTGLRPVFAGRKIAPRSKSTCCHCASRISRRRAPVRIKRQMAATANGSSVRERFSAFGAWLAAGFVSSTLHSSPVVSALRSASPSRESSSPVKNRSRECSLYRSIPRAARRKFVAPGELGAAEAAGASSEKRGKHEYRYFA
jgi:hypothetical protein